MTVGELIRKYRKDKKITQKKLSEMTGIAEITIRNYEARKYRPKVEQLVKISIALEIPPSKLADNVDDKFFLSAFDQVIESAAKTATEMTNDMVEFIQTREDEVYEAGKTAGQEEYVYQKIYFASDVEEKREYYALLHQKFKSGIITDKEKDELIELSHFFASALSDLQETANKFSDLALITESMEFVKNATPDVQSTPTVQDFLKLLLGVDEKNAVNFIGEFGNLMRDMSDEQREETAKSMMEKFAEFKSEAEKLLQEKGDSNE